MNNRIALFFLSTCLASSVSSGAEISATLNGLKIVLDDRTGAILRLEYPRVGKILETEPAEAGLVDVAYPLAKFEPLRLAARHSKGAKIERDADRIVIRINELGPSRANFAIDGNVAATVT